MVAMSESTQPPGPPRAKRRRRRVRSKPSVWGGVATRILLANSLMLIGIVTLAITLLYLSFSEASDRREESEIRSAAVAAAGSRDVVEPLSPHLPAPEGDSAAEAGPAHGVPITGVGREDEPTAPSADLAGRISAQPVFSVGSNERVDVGLRLEELRRVYDVDLLEVVPISALDGAGLRAGTSGAADAEPRGAVSVRAADSRAEQTSTTAALAGFDSAALRSGEVRVKYVGGTAGMLYAVAPVIIDDPEEDRVVAGAVVVGQHPVTIRAAFAGQVPVLVGIGGLIIVLGIIASWLTSRGLRRVTGDYGAEELRGMLDYYSSVMRAVSEGLVLVDRSLGVVFYNSGAAELLDLDPEGSGDPLDLDAVDVDSSLRTLLTEGRYARDEIHYTGSRILVVNQQPASESSDTWVTTMRDHTELQELIGELVSVRSFSESLRSQTHEYANRLHMIVSLVETGAYDEAAAFATREIEQMNRPADNLLGGIDHPVLSALLLTKLAQAGESGIELDLDASDLHGPISADDRDLVTVVGNLVDNAFDAVSAAGIAADRRRVHVRIAGGEPRGTVIEVADDGRGIREEDVDSVFERGWSTKHDGVESDTGDGRVADASRGVGLSLVVQAVRRMRGAIDVGSAAEDMEMPEGAEAAAPLRGALFSVWIPSAAESGAASADGDEAGAETDSKP